MKRAVDHNQNRINIAGRAAALAKRIDKLTAAAIKLQADAIKGERAEINDADDGRGYNGGWSLLTGDYSMNSLDNAATQLRRAAKNAGMLSAFSRAD